jgi:O-antigen ligase
LLVVAPLAFGSVHAEARAPFVGVALLAGIASLGAHAWRRRAGVASATLPGWAFLLSLNGLVAVQATPLPPGLVRLLSPAAHEYHRTQWRLPPDAWRTLSINPTNTRRGLAFLAGLSLFYGAVFREFGGERRARRMAATIIGVATLMTLVGFVQKASSHPGRIYGLWEPYAEREQFRTVNVFGPYANRSYYAGYVVMAVPLLLGFTMEALLATRRLWGQRKRGWTALGEPAASSTVLRTSLALFNVAGVLSAGSRTGVLACAVSTFVVALGFGRRVLLALGILGVVGTASLAFVDVDWFLKAVSLERLEADRLSVWRDMAKIVPDFPLFGVGWGALGYAYQWRYQTVHLWGRWDQAHNEYFEVLLDTGICGAAIVLPMIVLLVRGALRAASRSPFGVGLLGALLANAVTNLADFNLQVPANAATWTAIAAIAMRYGAEDASRDPVG